MEQYNVFGVLLRSYEPIVENVTFLRNESGILLIDWPDPLQVRDVDALGYDKRIAFENGDYTHKIILKKGDIICRYGAPTGKNTTAPKCSYEELSLPYDVNTISYHEYALMTDIVVTEGVVYPWFGRKGGGIQYHHKNKITYELMEEKIKEVYEWLEMLR